MYFAEKSAKVASLDELKASHNDILVTEIFEATFTSRGSQTAKDLILVRGISINKEIEEFVMTLEVLQDRVLAQFGLSVYIDLLNRRQSKTIISQVKPPFKISIFMIIDKVLEMNGR